MQMLGKLVTIFLITLEIQNTAFQRLEIFIKFRF